MSKDKKREEEARLVEKILIYSMDITKEEQKALEAVLQYFKWAHEIP